MKFRFLFAPGAGAPSTHPWMEHWSGLIEILGAVDLLDYEYMQMRRKRPDPLPKLIETHRIALEAARKKKPKSSTVLIGKSMGSRVGCHLALQEKVAAVICLGYPLCGGGDRLKLRDQVLLDLRTPVLFVSGDRDPLCPLDLLCSVRKRMKAPNELYVVKGGDHSLQVSNKVLKSSGESQLAAEEKIIAGIGSFLSRLKQLRAE